MANVRPEVSVVIPAHNAAGTIERAVNSILAQSFAPYEIIVVDDASTDGTIAKARACGPVKPVILEKHSGAGGARNAGIRAAQGSWVAFLDADDEWLPHKLERQVRVAVDGNVIFCASEEFAPDGASLGDTMRGQSVDCSADAWKSLLRTNFIATPTVMVRRDLLLRMGGFDTRMPVAEDQDLWIRLALAAPLTYVPETLVRVHVRSGSLSTYRPQDQSLHVLPMIERHLEMLGGKLDAAEIRAIRAERLSNAGRIAFSQGDVVRGGKFMFKAWLSGHHPGALLRASLAATAYRHLRTPPKRLAAS